MTSANAPSLADIIAAPKVLLHDHLDGGLRPKTVIELADQYGHELPFATADEASEWFFCGGDDIGNLPLYLEKFRHTIGVMQHADALHRVARECAEDLAADGVVYAEIRFAPTAHLTAGLTIDEVIETVVAGLTAGSEGTKLVCRVLAVALRHESDSLEVAEAAVRFRDRGVVGFDIAGPEDGFPPQRHLPAFQYLQRENFHFTIHAGEAFGPRSIWKALQWCGAERLGHGYRIIEDVQFDGDSAFDEGSARLGSLAQYVVDRRIPLEVCPTSNVHTEGAASIADHPIGMLAALGFRVTVNTDNRLMSRCSMSSEFHALATHQGWTMDDITAASINAAKSAFLTYDERNNLIDHIIVSTPQK